MWSRSLRTIFENIFSKFVNNGELLTMNFEYSASRWMEATHTYARVPTHTLTQTHTHIYTHIHIHHARAHIRKQGVNLHILVSGISPEGAVEHHFGATAQIHVTLWTGCIAMSLMCCKTEPFISFEHIKCLLTNCGGVKSWIFLKKVLSL